MTTGTSHVHGTQADDAGQHGDRRPRVRASDADRSATVESLTEAVALGLLSHDEGGERMAAALGTRFADELPALTADLPPTGPAPSASVPAAGWRRLGSALVTQVRHEARATREAGLRSWRFLVIAIFAVLAILALLGSAAFHGSAGAGFERAGSFASTDR
jgi:anti-sigma-K factor RskA